MAFEKAAASVENARAPARCCGCGRVDEAPRHRKVDCDGHRAAVCERGGADALDELYAIFPPTIVEVLGVSGIGAKTAALVVERLSDRLARRSRSRDRAATHSRACRAWAQRRSRTGSAASSPTRAASAARRSRRRCGIAREAMEYLRAGPPHDRLVYAGSARRQEVTVGDIDLVCTSTRRRRRSPDYFAKWERARAVLAEGATKTSIWLDDGFQIDLRVLPDHLYGNLLQHFTGSREHNIKLREYAVRKSLRVSENGILNLETGDAITCAMKRASTRRSGWRTFRRSYAVDSTRSIWRSQTRCRILLEIGDMRGDFHMHCTLERRSQLARRDDRGGEGARLRVSRDQRSLVGTRQALRSRSGETARAARGRRRASRAASEYTRFARAKSTFFPTARWTTTTTCSRSSTSSSERALGVRHRTRGDDGAAHSRVRKPVRHDHRTSDGTHVGKLSRL